MSAPYEVRGEGEGEGRDDEVDASTRPTMAAPRGLQNSHHRHQAVTYKDYANRVSHFPQQQQQPQSSSSPGGGGGGGGATSPRRSAPMPEKRSVAAPVDMNAAATQQSQAGSKPTEGSRQTNRREEPAELDERRDPPVDGDEDAQRNLALRIDVHSPATSIHIAEGTDADPPTQRSEAKEPLDQRDELEVKGLLRTPKDSPKREPQHPPSPTNPPVQQQLSSPSHAIRFPYIASSEERLLPPMSPAPSFTVNTEREGKKVMSQAEMSEMIRNSMIKARQQAAAAAAAAQQQQQQHQQHPAGAPHPPRATVVELLPSSLRSSFRMALKQQQPVMGRTPQGPFPWSPILMNAHAAGTHSLLPHQHQHHHHPYHPNPDDLEMRSMAEWTEPSQLTEPSALLAMNDHLRYMGGLQGGGVPRSLVLVDRGELYEEVQRSHSSKPRSEAVANDLQEPASASSIKGDLTEPNQPEAAASEPRADEQDALDPPGDGNTSTQVVKMGADEEPTRKLSLPSFDRSKHGGSADVSMVPQAAHDSEAKASSSSHNGKSRATSDAADNDYGVPSSQERVSVSYQSKQVKESNSEGCSDGRLADDLLRNDLPDTIESLRHLRHALSPRSGAGPAPVGERQTSNAEDSPRLRRDAPEEGATSLVPGEAIDSSGLIEGGRAQSPLQLPPAVDIMRDKDIDKLVSISMNKAQNTAKKEVQELFHDSRRRKDNIVVRTSEGDKVLSKTEVADLIKESMARARETAQLEIAVMVKDSLRLARESAQEEIRMMVEESMRRARESTQREMQEFVKESFQKARRSDGSAVSVGSSQAFTAADFTLGSFPLRQPSFGSSHIPLRSSLNGCILDHLSPLSEEEQNLLQDTHDSSLGVPSLRGNDALQETIDLERPERIVDETSPSRGQTNSDEAHQLKEKSLEPEGLEGVHIMDDDDVGSSLMVIKNCTSPDVFHGIEETDHQQLHASRRGSTGVVARDQSSVRRPHRRVVLEPEEEGIEIRSGNAEVTLDVPVSTPSEPSGAKDSTVTKRSSCDPSVAKEAAEKAKEAVASISETLRGYDEQKQKRIEEAAIAFLRGSEGRSRRSKDRRRRGGSVAGVESLQKPSRKDGNWSDRESGSSRPSSSKSHERNRWSSSRRWDGPSSAVARKPTKESHQSGSDRSSRRSSRSKRSSSTGRSKSSATRPCGAESVVTQEFLARLTTPKANLKDLMTTPKTQNLTVANAHDDEEEGYELHVVPRPGHHRIGSKDSVVTVPGNKFCFQFLQYLVNGGVGDESVAESEAVCSAFPRGEGGGREAVGPAAAEASSSSLVVPAGGGRLAALNPAAMFNKGSTWIDSLAEDMSSVLDGHDSTDIDTEGDTTFDDHDLSSYSQTDGEEEEDVALSPDDNSYNAGWWVGRRRVRPGKGPTDAKPGRKRRDPGDSPMG